MWKTLLSRCDFCQRSLLGGRARRSFFLPRRGDLCRRKHKHGPLQAGAWKGPLERAHWLGMGTMTAGVLWASLKQEEVNGESKEGCPAVPSGATPESACSEEQKYFRRQGPESQSRWQKKATKSRQEMFTKNVRFHASNFSCNFLPPSTPKEGGFPAGTGAFFKKKRKPPMQTRRVIVE